jgi:hypothetical protein
MQPNEYVLNHAENPGVDSLEKLPLNSDIIPEKPIFYLEDPQEDPM